MKRPGAAVLRIVSSDFVGMREDAAILRRERRFFFSDSCVARRLRIRIRAVLALWTRRKSLVHKAPSVGGTTLDRPRGARRWILTWTRLACEKGSETVKSVCLKSSWSAECSRGDFGKGQDGLFVLRLFTQRRGGRAPC